MEVSHTSVFSLRTSVSPPTLYPSSLQLPLSPSRRSRVPASAVVLCPLVCSGSDVCGCVDSVFRMNERAPETCAQLHVADCSVCLALPPCCPPAVFSAGGVSFAEVLRKNAGTAAPSTPGTATPAAASTTSAGAAADASGTEEAHAESTHAPSSGYKPRGGRRGG